MQEQVFTVTGRPITASVSFRMTIPYYLRLKQQAEEEKRTVSAILSDWIVEKLDQEGVSNGNGNHK